MALERDTASYQLSTVPVAAVTTAMEVAGGQWWLVTATLDDCGIAELQDFSLKPSPAIKFGQIAQTNSLGSHKMI